MQNNMRNSFYKSIGFRIYSSPDIVDGDDDGEGGVECVMSEKRIDENRKIGVL